MGRRAEQGRRVDPLVRLLLAQVDGAVTGRGWQGPTLLGTVRGVTVAQATCTPSGASRCIWQHVLHAAYWMYAVRRIIDPGAPAGFARSPSNWPSLPDERDVAAWRADVRLLKREYELLREAIERVDAASLWSVPGARAWQRADYIVGIASHSAYHAGQIQLLKRMTRRQ